MHIRDSNIYLGFATGKYEGNRVVILSGTRMDAIEAHNMNKTLTILGRYLLPQRPSTTKGQVVVITEDKNAGEVYVYHPCTERRQENATGRAR